MVKETDFEITLDTDKTIGSEVFARDFLTAWLNHPTEALRPERFDRGEPARRLIANLTFDQLVAEYCKGALVFARRTKPRMYVDLRWRREKGKDPKPFPWGLTAWIDQSAGPTLSREFLDFVVAELEPAFASLTVAADRREKHFTKWPHYVNGRHVGTAESFKGHHVLDTLPGVYWVTYFGPGAIERVGEERLLSIPIGRVERLGQGLVVTAYDDAAEIGTERAIAQENLIRRHLGEEHFFDLKTWTPPDPEQRA